MKRPDSSHASRCVASPNFGVRKAGIDCVILHYTGMTDGPSALDRLCDPASEVSCHYLVEEDGGIVQLVAEADRAWHAGKSCWAGQSDMNSCSIGIEIVNRGHDCDLPPYPAAQISGVVRLCRDIAARHTIAPERFLAHSDIAPSRKRDPGERFPWRHLHQQGVGHWVPPRKITPGMGLQPGGSGDDIAALQRMLAGYGYDLPVSGVYDAATLVTVAGFQRHFRPARVDGMADISTQETLRDLVAARNPS